VLGPTAHDDAFARDSLPPRDQWLDFVVDGHQNPDALNPAAELTDRLGERGSGARTALIGHERPRTCKNVSDRTNLRARSASRRPSRRRRPARPSASRLGSLA